MKKLLFALVAGLVLSAGVLAAPAAAQDMGKIKCSEFLASNTQEKTLLIMWIDGYISAKSDNTVLDDAWISKLGTHLGTFCGKNGNKTLMEAIDAMPGAE